MILALVEQRDGELPADAVEILDVVRDLADRCGVPGGAVSVGADGGAGALCRELGARGLDQLHLLRHELLDEDSPRYRGEALAQLVAHLSPEAVLAPSDPRSSEILAEVAARAGLPLATACTAVTPGEPWTVTRERAGGILLEDAELCAPVRLCTLARGAGAAGDGTAEPPVEVTVRTFVPTLDPAAPHASLMARRPRAAGVGLASAPVVVSGGRGVGGAEGYGMLEELASLLGGAVGCSRVATNNGWRPHRDQVGLTGTRISPTLYVACGISGATQHWVGCMGSKAILAINTDPEAPMVARSTWAVIGDLHEVLPAVIDELHRRSNAAVRAGA
jgi:electron transfer flavoprotein alpha subunit